MFTSIIIPTFNRAERLKWSLESLSKQKYDKNLFEIIIVNDARDKKTSNVVQDYIENLNIKELFGDGRGPATAKNIGIKNSSSDILVFLDDDVLCPSSFLQEHLKFHKDYSNNTVVTSQRRHLYLSIPGNDESLIENSLNNSFENLVSISYEDPHCKLLEKAYVKNKPKDNAAWVCLNGCNFSVKRELIEKISGFDENLTYLEDTDISLRMWENGGDFFYNEKATNYHLEHAHDTVARKRGWEKNFPVFHEKHKKKADYYKLFFLGKITYEEFVKALNSDDTIAIKEKNVGSYWFWEELSMRRWKEK